MISEIRYTTGFVIVLVFCGSIWWILPAFRQDTLPAYVGIDGKRFTLEVAVTEKEREKGLGGRENLCTLCAMLFVFEKPGQYTFWMKDMRFSLDIVWILKEEVVFIDRNVDPYFTGVLIPPALADRVVEFNAGIAKDLKVGERMQFFYGR